ncbi:MAG: DivIVA domain-containing protein [Oscillospiraceae bacterium]|nr:DivIVA domain-containing protein [Oscillospiraceae bacterium]
MITAKEIQRKKFEKVKFGYSPEEVDEFLSQIENDIRLMQQDLDDSNEKIQLLADKVREYKNSEEDIKNALLGAQKQAREVIDQAKARAAAMEEEAKKTADAAKSQALIDQETQLAQIGEKLDHENRVLVETQKQAAAFKQTLFDLYKEHLEQISRIPDEIDDEDDEYEEYDDEEEEYDDDEYEDDEYEDDAEDEADTEEETEAAAEDNAETVQESAAPKEEAAAPPPAFGSRRDDARSRF